MLLIVDDDPRFLESAEEALYAPDGVLFALTADQAFSLMRSIGTQVSAALVDLDLQRQDGFSLVLQFCRQYPEVPVIAISGVFQDHVLESAKILGAIDALHKPITPEWNAAIAKACGNLASS